MISAPLRPAQTTTSTPSVKTQGHLALLEWNETLPVPAEPKPFGPKPRTFADRCYDGGTLILFAVSAAAMALSLARF